MGTIQSIDHVQLGFAPSQQSLVRHFYGQLLGLPEVGGAGGGAGLRFGAGAQRIDLVALEEGGSARGHLALAVRNLPGLRARLQDAGFVLDGSRPLPGHLRFYVTDPAGNALEFLEPEGGTSR